MSDDNEQKPLGYGHDKKGVAGGVAKDESHVHVAHKAPVSGAAEVRLSAGAEFIVAICGEIMTMPGLPKVPAADSIALGPDGRIVGLF